MRYRYMYRYRNAPLALTFHHTLFCGFGCIGCVQLMRKCLMRGGEIVDTEVASMGEFDGDEDIPSNR